jgi:hypothetical protein
LPTRFTFKNGKLMTSLPPESVATVFAVSPPITNDIAAFFAGAFICNCVPHLVAALQGNPFPSPFAKPPGRGDSSPVVNFFWGSFNLLVGGLLLAWHPISLGLTWDFAAFIAGFLALGVQLSLHFGKVHGDRAGK